MLVVILAVVAVSAVVLGIVGLAGRLPRNRWVGVRSEQTLSDDLLWRTANRVAGPGLLASGVIFGVGAAATAVFDAPWAFVYAGISLVGGVFLAGFGALQGARAASIQARIQTGQVTVAPARDGGVEGDPAGSCGVTGGCGSCALNGLCDSSAHPA